MGRKRWIGWMKELLIGGAIIFAITLLVNWLRAPQPPDTEIPALEGVTLRGVPVNKVIVRGAPLMIHFWGTWCPVCRQEADNIGRVARHYPVLTVAVNSGSAAEIESWMKRKGVDYPVLNDPSGNLARRFNVEIFPTTFIYDSGGKLKFVETGYSTTLGLLARMKMAE